MHLDRVCPISITLCCFQIWFHLPVAIPWAPPCVGIWTLQLDLQGLDHSCTWRGRTEQRDRSDSKLHTRAEEKWFVFSRAPWAKIGGWADRKQRLQLHFSCLECDKPSVPSQHILVRRMVKGWRTYCLCNKTKNAFLTVRKETVLLGIHAYSKCTCWKYLQSAPAKWIVYLYNNNNAVLSSCDLEPSKGSGCSGCSCSVDKPNPTIPNGKTNPPTTSLPCICLWTTFVNSVTLLRGVQWSQGNTFSWGIQR